MICSIFLIIKNLNKFEKMSLFRVWAKILSFSNVISTQLSDNKFFQNLRSLCVDMDNHLSNYQATVYLESTALLHNLVKFINLFMKYRELYKASLASNEDTKFVEMVIGHSI